jgi:hypothetical protein
MRNGPGRNRAELNNIIYSIFNFLHHILTSENTLILDIFTDLKNSNEWINSLGLGMSFFFQLLNNVHINANFTNSSPVISVL